MAGHSHQVECDEDGQKLVIYRIHEDGRREVHAEFSFAGIKAKGYAPFVSELGEAIVADAPVLRWLLDET
ncbi:MAG: hypothetical protein AB7F74_18715 [Parvibaculaceae bacterium]